MLIFNWGCSSPLNGEWVVGVILLSCIEMSSCTCGFLLLRSPNNFVQYM